MSGLVLVAGLAGCGEEETPPPAGPTPPDPLGDVPPAPDAGLDEGNWTREQRGVYIDRYDFAVIQREESAAGISAQKLRDSFGHLVLNLPYLDYIRGGAGSNPCVDANAAERARPRAAADEFLALLKRDKALEFDSLVVNVDLTYGEPILNAQGEPTGQIKSQLAYVCGDTPFYGDVRYRRSIIEAFEEVATLPNLKYLTVGLELNKYSYFRNDEDEPIPEDYVNLVTLYREIYAAVKAKTPEVQVGPGLSWDFLMNISVRDTAKELALDDETGVGAWYRAWQRTVLPFLVGNGEPGKPPTDRSADFVGFTVTPETEGDPFRGSPSPVDDVQAEEISAYYRYMALAGAVKAGGGGPLPVALTQVDWPVQSQAQGRQKGPFLRTLKRNVSHVDIAFASWRRLSDLVTRLEGDLDPACDIVMAEGHPKEYCNAGLLGVNGEPRKQAGVPDADVFGVFTQDP